ncbi:hypothetical protein [Aquimarina agarivorans]|uniref:hypothetical protein n=1 Tax=Aquimarina agarivorans TaxID=980584 RepID=UPI000248E935|nr:hypothetical protein [Aquimarina agarivorans]
MTRSQAQNKIDYIVFHQPKATAMILYDYGFEVPKETSALSKSIKALIREEGTKVIEQLLELHPDTKAILSLKERKKTNCSACQKKTFNSEGSYCESCGHNNYLGSGDEDSFLEQFDHFSDTQLEKYYRGAVKRSNETPENKTLAQEVQLIWNELRLRKQDEKSTEKGITTKETKGISKDDLILLGMVFVAGILVGHGLKTQNITYGK